MLTQYDAAEEILEEIIFRQELEGLTLSDAKPCETLANQSLRREKSSSSFSSTDESLVFLASPPLLQSSNSVELLKESSNSVAIPGSRDRLSSRTSSTSSTGSLDCISESSSFRSLSPGGFGSPTFSPGGLDTDSEIAQPEDGRPSDKLGIPSGEGPSCAIPEVLQFSFEKESNAVESKPFPGEGKQLKAMLSSPSQCHVQAMSSPSQCCQVQAKEGNAVESKPFPGESKPLLMASCNAPKPMNYFYQANDGGNLFLCSMNLSMLVTEFGSVEKCPLTITGKILEKEYFVMNDTQRQRVKYLRHLPLFCPFETVEVDLRPPLVSEKTLESYRESLLKRQRHRRARAAEERKIERRNLAQQEKEFSGRLFKRVDSAAKNISMQSEISPSTDPVLLDEHFPQMGVNDAKQISAAQPCSAASKAPPSFAKMLQVIIGWKMKFLLWL